MIQHLLTALYIGETARQTISQGQAGQVLGVTSRGVFLHFPTPKIIFLSYEPYKGPLTLNLGAVAAQLERLSPGNAVQVNARDLYFDALEIRILSSEAVTWQAPAPVGAVQPEPEIHKQLVSIARQLLAQNRTSEISSLLPHILGFPNESTGISAESFPGQEIQKLQQALHSRQTSQIAARLESLSGFGGGLTPSGDDLTIGLLLTLNRWGETLVPGIELQELNHSVVQSAAIKTSALSANLIECAVNGEADERLINALDGIMTGIPDSEACARLLLSWGNSSGGDTLTGIALALSLLDAAKE
jgi:hypothetical protein